MYAVIMSILSLFGKSSNEILNFLIIIPIIGQMVHFYWICFGNLVKHTIERILLNILNQLNLISLLVENKLISN